jgi:Tfp pilus assembly protein PilO
LAFLNTLDSLLLQISKKELIYLYVMLVGIMFFLSYKFLFESSQYLLDETIKTDKTLSKEIREMKDYLMFHDDFELEQIKINMKKLSNETEMLKAQKDVVSNKIASLSEVIYSKESWTQFLNNLSIIAIESGIEILSIKNQFLETGQNKFDIRLKIELKTNSKFINIIKFMDKLESSKLIVNIDNLSMKISQEGILGEFSLSIWGIKTYF